MVSIDAQSVEPVPTELIFLGTGTSGATPAISCLTSPTRRCKTCLSPNPKNRRMNTSCLLRIGLPDGETRNLLIDCGKTFFPMALQQFPRLGIRQIDGLVLTHAHADAFFGLDDLRAFTLPSKATDEPAVQEHIDVYCSRATMVEVERTFPYLVDRERATGGGDVPSFVWHVFDDDAIGEDGRPGFIVPSCGGVRVIPLPVQHGVYMDSGMPFMCLGFRVGDFSWVSDCSGVPERTERLMRGSRVVVMDGLKWDPHASHFSIQEGREWIRDHLGPGVQHNSRANGGANGTNGAEGGAAALSGPERTWMVGFAHNVEHEHATLECEAWGRSEDGRGLWVRPAWDGLRIGIDGAQIDADE